MNPITDAPPATLAPQSAAPPPAPAPDDPRIVRALEDYAAALKAGQKPDRHEFQARYPEVAEVLAECLEGLEFVQAAASHLQTPNGAQPAAASWGAQEVQPEGPLGDYRIVREIGRGGMGVVYEAVQTSLGRRVALKVLPFAAALDTKQLQRFKNEAHAAAQLHHSNIVPVFGVGSERGIHFYAMQYIEGQTLAAVIEELRQLAPRPTPAEVGATKAAGSLANDLVSGRWAPVKRQALDAAPTTIYLPSPEPCQLGGTPAAEITRPPGTALSTERSTTSAAFFRTVAQLGVQAAEGLEHAHQLGVVHRDIKPANLLVDAGGRLWITDFGLARLGDDPGLTMTGDLLGTIRYMSPEQALGNRVLVDQRTDIYSLGVTLYEVLTQTPAYTGRDRQELLRQIAFEEPRPPRRWNAAIPTELETIVLKAVEKNPAERYASAGELADDLERFLKDEPIRAKRPGWLVRARKWIRRHRAVVATALTAVGVLLITTSILATLSALWLRDERNATRDQLAETQKAQREGRRQLYKAKLAQAQASRWSRQPGQRFDSWQALTEAAQIAKELQVSEASRLLLRNEAIACLALPDVRFIKDWQGWPTGSTGLLGFDAHLEHYARSDAKGNISIRRVTDDKEQAVLPGPGNNGANILKFSPNGLYLAVWWWQPLPGKSINFQVWDWRRRAVVFQPLLPVRADGDFFSPDSRLMAVGHDQGTVLYKVAAWKEVTRLAWGSKPNFLAFHPDGTKLAICGLSGRDVQVYDIDTGKLLFKLSHPATVHWVAWHPDGILLATACNDMRVYLWDGATGRQHAVLQGHQNAGIGLAFAPGGDLLLSWAWDDTARLWDPWTGRQLLRFAGANGYFSRDGCRLALQNGAKASLWQVARDREYRTLFANAGASGRNYTLGGISPNGRWLAFGAADGVQLWDLARGRASAFLPLGCTQTLAFHPKGEGLFTAGPHGLYRWPFHAQAGLLRVGPGKKLPLTGGLRHIAFDATGRTLAAACSGGGVILDLNKGRIETRSFCHHQTQEVATSPDGRWVASATQHGFGVKVWEGRTGRCVQNLISDSRFAKVAFSPDGQWLVTATAEDFCFWKVKAQGGPWQRQRQITRERGGFNPGPIAFTPDMKMLALTISRDMVRLMDPASGRELATFHQPHADEIQNLYFSPDGSQLVARTATPGLIRLWDLRLIRARLKKIGLDWDMPPYPPAAPRAGLKPLRFEVDLGDLAAREKYSVILAFFPFHAEAYYQRGLAYAGFDQAQQALADFNLAVTLKPDHVDSHYQRGLLHLGQGHWAQARADFSRTITLQPEHAAAHAKRAQAYQGLKQWKQAIRDYSTALARQPDSWVLWHNRGLAFGEQSQWARAGADFEKAATKERAPEAVGYYAALLHLHQGDTAGYRRACGRLVQRYSNATEPWSNDLVAWTCVLAPNAVTDPAQLLPLAERAGAEEPKTYAGLSTVGAVLYRAGRFEQAVQQLTKAAAAWKSTDNVRQPLVYHWLFLAMAHQRCGHDAAARQWLDKAVRWIDEALMSGKAKDDAQRYLPWNRKLTLLLLRREAEALVQRPGHGPADPERKSSRP